MKKIIAIMALAAAPVLFAQQKRVDAQPQASSLDATTSKTKAESIKQEELKKREAEAVSKKAEDSKALEAKKAESSRNVNKVIAPQSLKEESSRKASTAAPAKTTK
ncbi:hypothetical protein [Moheibacter stercoris]|uniref:Tfp pilus assembly protein FimT n=1 Tax=Moheibacter stercoris TaxID=1628251 RepID=A0ABV2LT89_9FLAO